jgi:CRISPR type III-A-associated RAMP protein Csm4
MNPGLVVKLRPAGPWRIGTDSGARNRVDAVYHSDSLYSAVASAMVRLGTLDEWLDATARNGGCPLGPAVSFSSCFPFLDEIRFVVPPRTIWPPTSPALMSARVRWKSARFVPLGVVQAMLAGEAPDENHWSLDGASECLVPAGRPGPFRTGVRWSAAVDRLTGAAERHSTACIEFRPGAGFWTIVSFQDEAAHSRWMEPVKAAFRLLADTGFGGERSRGWGRSEPPEFTDGMLPDLVLDPPPKPAPEPLAPEPAVETAVVIVTESITALAPLTLGLWPIVAEPAAEPAPSEPGPEPQEQQVTRPAPVQAHWLLSLFTPAPDDSVDWRRGNYAVLARSGRVDSPAGSGELKKEIQMVAEGSVLYAAAAPRGSAADVAPDGFAHPVFRAGFALSIPLPGPSEVS